MEESCIIRLQSYEDLLKLPPPEKLIIYKLFKYTYKNTSFAWMPWANGRNKKLSANREAGQ